jgi:hypothetical protein
MLEGALAGMGRVAVAAGCPMDVPEQPPGLRESAVVSDIGEDGDRALDLRDGRSRSSRISCASAASRASAVSAAPAAASSSELRASGKRPTSSWASASSGRSARRFGSSSGSTRVARSSRFTVA